MSFWEKGYKALFISSFYNNPHMHSSGDTLDKI
ncbi:MAG: peptidase M28, partial [Deltaproteobacteria bacterium]|nr:peptidase M28 [Deltaproteobacteria bacterium]